jgi:stage V sporulation protein B
MSARHKLFRNAAILTVAGFISRIFGFLFRIFLSRSFGEESVGLYQMIFPLYILWLSLSTAGLQTAVSRITAEKTALGHNKEADGVLTAALCLAVVISLIEILVIQDQAGSIAGSLFGDDRCMELILIISYALPFAAVHSCICGRSLGLGDTMLPAASQLIEQCVRILTVVLLWIFLRTCGLTPSIRLAAAGVVAGEMAAALFTVRGLRLQRPVRAGIRELFAFSAPLTANRTALTLLQSIEAVSIPASLIRYGMSATEAVSLYGVLTGMALPCILFPSALTGSVGTVLLPAVSAASTSGNRRSVFLLLRKAIVSCFSLGLACCLFFLLFGKMIGRFLFHSADAGRFIITLAWICPFLYVNSSLLNAVNGYGRTGTSFLISMSGLLIRIAGVFLAVPQFGIQGYLWALLGAQLCTTVLASAFVVRLNGRITPSPETDR